MRRRARFRAFDPGRADLFDYWPGPRIRSFDLGLRLDPRLAAAHIVDGCTAAPIAAPAHDHREEDDGNEQVPSPITVWIHDPSPRGALTRAGCPPGDHPRIGQTMRGQGSDGSTRSLQATRPSRSTARLLFVRQRGGALDDDAPGR